MKVMANNKFLLPFFISLLIYFILDYFLNETMMYVMGGAILGSLNELFNSKIQMFPSILIWCILLLGLIVLFYRTRKQWSGYVFIVVIAATMYVVDFIIYEIVPRNTQGYLMIGMTVLSKSLILSIVIYAKTIKPNLKTG